ncbi:Gag-Pol polyprotein [Anthophora quadrimaculata]
MPAREAGGYTVLELKDMLRAYGLNTAGTKAELIARLRERDPSGQWMSSTYEEGDSRSENVFVAGKEEGAVGGASVPLTTRSDELEKCRWEIDLLRREKALMERELEVTRRELELSRMQRPSISEERPAARSGRIGVTTVAELLKCFDGKSEDFSSWAKQIQMLQATYRLEDEEVKILMGMRLRGKAQEWMQSRPEFIEMNVGQLLGRCKEMFHHRPSMVIVRQQFQERIWKRGEPFDEYFYDKIIKANRVPVEDQIELVEYLVEGIPDPVLRNQARMQCFNTPDALLRAFEKVSLSSGNQGGGVRVDNPKPAAAAAVSTTGVRKVDEWAPNGRPDRCYNCGGVGHLGRNCPTRQRGAKCYHCGEHGHIAPECQKRDERQATRSTNYMEQPATEKTCKMVRLNGHDIRALVDTGSDLTLMTAACYVKIGAPRLLASE